MDIQRGQRKKGAIGEKKKESGREMKYHGRV